MEPKITITITDATAKLSKHVTEAIEEYDTYKYTYLKQLLSRLRAVEHSTNVLSIDDKILLVRNVLITERNVAAFAAEQYAALDQEEVFNSFTEIMEEIEGLINEA